MSSLHHIQHSHLQPLEGSHDPAPHLIPFFPVYDPSSFTYPAFPLYPAQPQACRQDLHCRLQDDESSLSGGSSDHPDLQLLMLSLQSKDGDHDRDDKSAAAAARGCSSAIHDAAAGDANGSVKWMSSKMRLMRRMMSGDEGAGVRKLSRRSPVAHPPPDELQQQQGITRVCSDCNTTRTPLWRSGPQGPKSLCNACGIRQRKARKAMAAAAAAVVNTTATDHKLPKEKCPQDSGGGGCDRPIVPFKKRCKFANPPDAAAEAEGQKSFPQDEKDAAILLMALSCGTLVCR